MRKILLLLLLLMGNMAEAQQEAMYTHYMYNIMAINPAYAGYEKKLTATLIHRSQWVSIPGAPRFQTFSMQAPIGDNVGAGLSFVNDQIGPERNIAIKGYYSYTLRSEEKVKITFGLKAGLNMLQIGLSDLEIDEPDDPAFLNNIQSAFLPNFGFGIFVHSRNFYFGFSMPDLIQHDYLNNTIFSSSDLTLDSKKYYLLGGLSYAITDRLLFKPSGFIGLSKATENQGGVDVEGDLTALFIADNKFAGGIMIRSSDAIAFLAGIMITKDLEFGYSFDMLLSNKTFRYNGGSHEIVLKYNFRNKLKYRPVDLSCPTFQ